MFGSGVLDTVIGVVFVFLLVSLIVTTCNELVAAMLRSRAKWLEYGIDRLIGSTWARRLYAHPLIEGSTTDWKPAGTGERRWLTPAATGTQRWWKRAEPGKRSWFGSGPSYIPSRAFANIVVELLHGDGNALRQTKAALQRTLALVSSGAASVADIEGAVDALAASLPGTLPANVAAAIRTDLQQLCAMLKRNDAGRLAGYSVADAVADVRRFAQGIPANYVRHMIEALTDEQDEKVRKVLLTLVDDAGNDVEKFKQNIEVWFNNGMDRVGGWYKRRSQWVTGAISLVVVVSLNVDTVLIVRYLDASAGVRNGLLTEAKAYADASVPYTRKTTVSNKAQQALVTATVPDGVAIPVLLDLQPSYPAQINRIQQQLMDLKLPIGWARKPSRADQDMALGIPETAEGLGETIVVHLLGWLITAVAATLGAPFWFDMLNRIMSIRSAGRAPEEMPKSPAVVQAPIGPGQSAKQANENAALARSGTR